MSANLNMVGCIGFSAPVKGGNWFQWAIRICTGIKRFSLARATHMFILDRPRADEDTVLQAGFSVANRPLSDYRGSVGTKYIIFRLNGVPMDSLLAAVDKCYKKYSNERYGFEQLPWFAWRKVCQIVGMKIGLGQNFFPEFKVCSGLGFELENEASGNFKQLLAERGLGGATSAPEDLLTLAEDNPQLFSIVEQSGDWKR